MITGFTALSNTRDFLFASLKMNVRYDRLVRIPRKYPCNVSSGWRKPLIFGFFCQLFSFSFRSKASSQVCPLDGLMTWSNLHGCLIFLSVEASSI